MVNSLAAGRHQDVGHGRAGAADDRLDRGHVGLAERAVLGEDDDLLAGGVADEGLRGEHVLVGLAPGAEGVAVHAGEAVGGGRAGDEQHLVLRGDRRDLQADTGGGRAGDDLDALADEVLRRGDGLGRVAGVVDLGDLDRVGADLVGAVGGVGQAGLEALQVLLAVAGERAGLGVDEAYLVRRCVTGVTCGRLLWAAASGDGQGSRANQRDAGDESPSNAHDEISSGACHVGDVRAHWWRALNVNTRPDTLSVVEG